MPRYFNEGTGQPLHLYFGWHLVRVDNVEVELEGVPLLKNEATGEIIFTFKSDAMVNYFVEEAKKNKQLAIRLSPKPRNSKRYGYCHKADFIYSDIDYEHIPGLMRPWDEGFLTPVFFKSAILNKYTQNPDYHLNLFSENYGNIETDDWIISFGVNRNQRVVMWLGDINSLPLEEQYYLRSENVESDHEIHSEFYDAQIDCIPSPPSKQRLLLRSRSELDILTKKNNGFPLYQLQGEVDRIVENLNRPIFWEDRHVTPVVEALNKVFVESLNINELKSAVLAVDSSAKIKPLGSLKSLGIWLEKCLHLTNAYEVMTPFYVLYDYRIVCAHLTSDSSRLGTLESVNARLGLDRKNRSNQSIYDLLIEGLIHSIESISNAAES